VSTRSRVITVVCVAAAGVIGYWMATRTYWADTVVPMPPRGEALTNPFYAAERFVSALGGRGLHDRTFIAPPSNAIVVLSGWNWNLSASRRERLQQWVESGGRLVLDRTVNGGPELERWAGIRRQDRQSAEDTDGRTPPARSPCVRVEQVRNEREVVDAGRPHWLCDLDFGSVLTTARTADWLLREKTVGVQAARMRVGRGTVSMINGTPVRYRAIFDGDHGWLLAASTQMRRGDDVHFLTEGDAPSLVALMWTYGAPVVWLSLTVVGLLLWRAGVRLGPLTPPPVSIRRSLGEQISGTGRFALAHEDGESLHAATAQALDVAARRRIPGWGRLQARERIDALARAGDVAPDELADALRHPAMRGPTQVRGALALIETVRRRLLAAEWRTRHGTT
jgi:hypothetical protein